MGIFFLNVCVPSDSSTLRGSIRRERFFCIGHPPSPLAFVHVAPSRVNKAYTKPQVHTGDREGWLTFTLSHCSTRTQTQTHTRTLLQAGLHCHFVFMQRDVSPVTGSREGVVTSWIVNDGKSEKMKTRKSVTSKGWTLFCLWTCQHSCLSSSSRIQSCSQHLEPKHFRKDTEDWRSHRRPLTPPFCF